MGLRVGIFFLLGKNLKRNIPFCFLTLNPTFSDHKDETKSRVVTMSYELLGESESRPESEIIPQLPILPALVHTEGFCATVPSLQFSVCRESYKRVTLN